MDIKILAWLNQCLTQGDEKRFYLSPMWRRKRKEVLAMDKHECQLHKQRGQYRKATMVHHVNQLKHRPDLGLSVWDGKERNLLSLCNDCHEEIHNHRQETKEPVTVEWWG